MVIVAKKDRKGLEGKSKHTSTLRDVAWQIRSSLVVCCGVRIAKRRKDIGRTNHLSETVVMVASLMSNNRSSCRV